MADYPSILVDEKRDAPGAMAAAAAAQQQRQQQQQPSATTPTTFLPPVAPFPSRLPAQVAPAPSPAAAPIGSSGGGGFYATAAAAASASSHSPASTPRRRRRNDAFADGLPLPPSSGGGASAAAPPPAPAPAYYPHVAASAAMATVQPPQPPYNPMQPYRTSGGGPPPPVAATASPFAQAAQALAGKQRLVWQPRTPPRPLERRLSWGGLLLLLMFLAATSYYLYVRGTVSLQMGKQTPYGAFVFAVELMGLASVLPYALMLVVYTAPTPQSRGLPADDGRVILPAEKRFHVRVLVPCYKEPLAVVKNTVNAALGALLPPGVSRTVYLCDDGGDAEKAALMAKLHAQGGRYVTGRKRTGVQINGKSCNLNNCLKNVIYKAYLPPTEEEDQEEGGGGKEGGGGNGGNGGKAGQEGGGKAARSLQSGAAAVAAAIPPQEVIVVFDADMAAKPNFFLRVLEVMWDDSVGLCLTPQKFRNVEPNADIFNNINQQFWQYVLPGCDAWGYVACTGTNFCIRAKELARVGWFPEYTITEDYALSMELKMAGVRGRYLSEYLAVGEAPTEVRNVCRQRSRWTKGHMQIFFSWDKCPLLQWRLPLVHKLLYTNGTYAYFATIATSVVFTLVPFVSLVFGLHPVAFSKTFAIAATVYLPMNFAVQNFARERGHLRGQWLASVSNQVLCFTYIKAVWNTLLAKMGVKEKAGFKATEKAGGKGKGGAGGAAQAAVAALRRAGSGVAAAVARAGSGSLAGGVGVNSGNGGGQAPVLAAAAREQQAARERRRLAEEYDRRVRLARAQGLPPPPPPPALAGAAPPRGASSVPSGPLGPVRLEKQAKKKSGGGASGGGKGPSGGGAGSAGGARHAADDDDDDDDKEGCWAWTNAKTLEGALDPLWLALSLGVSVSAIAAGATSLARSGSLTGYTVRSWQEFADLFSSGRLGVYTLVPMLWAAYNAVPPILFFLYFFTKGRLLRGTAIVCQVLTFVFGAAAVSALWLLVPNEYDVREVLPAATAFLDAQRASGLPPWPMGAGGLPPVLASPAADLLFGTGSTTSSSDAFHSDPVPGGYFMGSDYVKHSFPLSSSLTTLSWSLLTFSAGYAAAGARGPALLAGVAAAGADDRGAAPWPFSAASSARGVVRHAARYLCHCHVSEFEFVVRQGNPSDYVVEVLREGEGGGGDPARRSLLAASGGGGGEGGQVAEKFDPSRAITGARGFWDVPGRAPTAAANRTAARLTLSSAGGADALASAAAGLAAASLALRMPSLRDHPSADPLTRGASLLPRSRQPLPPPFQQASRSVVESSGGSSGLSLADEDEPDEQLAAEALRHARQLYTFALALQAATVARPLPGTPLGAVPTYCAQVGCHQGKSAAEGGGYRWLAFPSSSALDDLALAAAWLWRATGTRGYLEDARAHLAKHWSGRSGEAKLQSPDYYALNHDNAAFPAAILLASEDDGRHGGAAPPSPEVQQLYRDALSAFSRAWMTGRTAQGSAVVRQTPRGLSYLAADGAPLPAAMAAAHLAMQAAAVVRAQQQDKSSGGAFASLPSPAAANLECFARRQVNYALGGELGQGRSFVVGVGRGSPQRVLHRRASCPQPLFPGAPQEAQPECGLAQGLLSALPNPLTLTGAIVAGPDAEDGYPDDRPEPSSAVGFHLQVPFVAALAALSAPGPVRQASCASDATGGFAAMSAAAEAAARAGAAGGGGVVGVDGVLVPPDPLSVSIV